MMRSAPNVKRTVRFLAIFDHPLPFPFLRHLLRFTHYVSRVTLRLFPVALSKIPPNCLMPSASLVTLSNISKRYDSPGNGNALTVLDNISLEIERGQSLAIIGPSGSGKSTLLQIIGTLDRPTSGAIQLDGQDLNKLDEVELAAVRTRT